MQSSQIRRWLPWIMWFLAALFYFYNFLLRVIPSLISSELMQTLMINPIHLAQIVSIYYVSYTLMQIPIGLIIDRYGVRLTLTIGCLCCCLSMLFFINLRHYYLILLSRLLLGFGSAFSFIGAIKIIRVWLSDKHLGLLSSITNTLGMLGAMSSFALLTPMIEIYQWQPIAISITLSTLLLSLLIYLTARDDEEEVHEDSHSFQQLFASIQQLIKEHPLLLLNGVVGCLSALPTTCFADLWAKLYFSQGFHFSNTQAATATSFIFLGWAIGSPIFGRVSDYYRNYHLPFIVGVAGIFICFSLILSYPIQSYYELITLCFVFGVFASCQTLVFPIACEFATVATTGTAIAITNASVMVGSLLFQPLVAWIIQSREPLQVSVIAPIYSLATYQIALSSLVLATLLCFGLAVLQYRLHCRHRIN